MKALQKIRNVYNDGHRLEWWPVAFGRFPHTEMRGGPWFDWHGWQTRWARPGVRVFGQTFHFGLFQVYLGPRKEKP